ncbi:MAG TPA: DUF192 domain-containing protein [Gammaproteobacteria bacterium]
MRTGKLYLLEGQLRRLLLDTVMQTDTMLERMRGLLWRRPLTGEEALIIDKCGSVHTCGIKYPLDLAFIDRQSIVRKLVRRLQPWRMAWCFSAVMTLEMPPGLIDQLKLEVGMRLLWQESTGE